MDKVKVCRVCLLSDVNLYDIHKYPWDTYFEAIIGVNPLSMLELPPFICSQCAHLVRKYSFFKDKCLRGEAKLYELLYRLGQITLEDVKKINRNDLQLDLTLKRQFSIEVTTDGYAHNEISIINDTEVKSEPNIDSLDLFNNDVKQESYDDFPPLPMSSEDDEPLSLHKSKKDKKIKREKKRKRKKVLDEDADDKSGIIEEFQNMEATDLSELPPEISAVVQPRKRGRPRKSEVRIPKTSYVERKRRTKNTGGVEVDEVDLSEFVTVIQLSVAEQLEEISNRQQSSNYKNAAYQCKLCYKGFIDSRAWKHHLSKHDPSAGDIECPICKFRFKTKRTLQKHATNHEKKYACRACSYVSKTTTQAKQHQRWHKGVTYKCQYCDEVSTKWTSYLSHVRIKHPSEFICGICGYSFVSKLGLTMHKTMMHKDVADDSEATEQSPYCAECDVKFISTEAFKRHMVTSAKHITHDNSNGCRVCGESFPSPEALRLHHRTQHAKKRPKNYGKRPTDITWPAKCQHCSEEIANAREYWTHFRRAHPDQPYPIQKDYICDICGKSFRGNAFLVYHKRTHFEERAYKCPLCPKAFFNRTNLQMHEKTHSDNRPYPCTVCFKAFKCKGALDRHFRSHTGLKPYPCEVCGKSFGQSNSRKLHVRTVHLKQPAPYISRNRVPRKLEHSSGQTLQQFNIVL